ncbi:hypothetical protein AGR4A_pAt30207 [Agrobacterium tumefaciens str. B6]|uniref:Uncharacterized protein n=1 Tax=Agrobacterium tumefaciens str. B6 TaxID=1183423 RepID=A0A822V7B3_AGRTU|nr:hypothetical protein AGR4A_pAt30207 [Agrobacterium tumefaciens str. B6]
MSEFWQQLRKWIADLGAALGGVDAEYLINEKNSSNPHRATKSPGGVRSISPRDGKTGRQE